MFLMECFFYRTLMQSMSKPDLFIKAIFSPLNHFYYYYVLVSRDCLSQFQIDIVENILLNICWVSHKTLLLIRYINISFKVQESFGGNVVHFRFILLEKYKTKFCMFPSGIGKHSFIFTFNSIYRSCRTFICQFIRSEMKFIAL